MESSRTSDLLLSKEALQRFDHNCTDIYFLTQREVALILSCIRYADWDSRWEDRVNDYELVSTLKRKLLMLCAEMLVKAQVATICAITGRQIDLGDNNAVEVFLSSYQDFSEDGLVPAIDRLSGASESEDYTDELILIAQGIGVALA